MGLYEATRSFSPHLGDDRRDAAHYERMMRRNPNAMVGHGLAATAMCVARDGLDYSAVYAWFKHRHPHGVASTLLLHIMSNRYRIPKGMMEPVWTKRDFARK